MHVETTGRHFASGPRKCTQPTTLVMSRGLRGRKKLGQTGAWDGRMVRALRTAVVSTAVINSPPDSGAAVAPVVPAPLR